MQVPIIDISSLTSTDIADRRRVAAQLGEACETVGFLSVVGHGVDPSLLTEVFTQCRRLFDLPGDEKLAAAWGTEHQNRGYDPPGNQRLDPEAPPEVPGDAKEAWSFGPEHLAGSSGPMQQANVWPVLDGFRPVVEAYHQVTMDLSERLLAAFALALGLDEGYFGPFHRRPVCTLRLLHYPPRAGDADPLALGAGAHTDWGAVTVLAQDDAGSLEVLTRDGAWLEVPPHPGAFVINVGDLLARWTNDRYRSTMHRVRGATVDRYSIACFFDLDHDARIECLPTCCSDEDPPRYEATTAGHHLEAMFRRSLAG